MNLREKDYEVLWGRTIPDVKYDVDANGNIIYEGLYPPGQPTSSPVWIVAKYTYDANNNLTDAKIRTNIAWDNRAGIS